MNRKDMKTSFSPLTIGEITFRIPLVQRPFAWEELQVRGLLEDLHAAFSKNREGDYHLGVLSLSGTSDDQWRHDLLDGQQRITTLLLIGKELSTHCPMWDGFLSSDRLDLYGRKADQAFLHEPRRSEGRSEANPKLRAAREIARNFWQKEVPDKDKAAFARFVFDHSVFFLSVVPSTYSILDRNQQFVRMNNRGRQLEKHEILKVRLLRQIQDPKAQESAFTTWNSMVECLTGVRSESRPGHRSLREILTSSEAGKEPAEAEPLYSAILTIPEFLLIALKRALPGEAISPNPDTMLETFQSALSDPTRIKMFMDILNRQVETHKTFFIFLSKDGEYEIGTLLDPEESFDDLGPWERRLVAIQSFLHVSTEPHHWLVDAYTLFEGRPEKRIQAERFFHQLEEIDARAMERRKLTPVESLDEMTYPGVSHYWFYRLDYELWKRWENQTAPADDVWHGLRKNAKIARIIKGFRFRRLGSVEHITPQNPEGEKNPISDHTFRNLALLSSSQNSRFNNADPELKKDLIFKTEKTESLKMLHFLSSTEAGREDAGRLMFSLLKRSLERQEGQKT